MKVLRQSEVKADKYKIVIEETVQYADGRIDERYIIKQTEFSKEENYIRDIFQGFCGGISVKEIRDAYADSLLQNL